MPADQATAAEILALLKSIDAKLGVIATWAQRMDREAEAARREATRLRQVESARLDREMREREEILRYAGQYRPK